MLFNDSSQSQWPYHRRYRNVLADCFDVYLMMRRKIDQQVSETLAHNTANWRVLNSCPPCSYEVSTSNAKYTDSFNVFQA